MKASQEVTKSCLEREKAAKCECSWLAYSRLLVLVSKRCIVAERHRRRGATPVIWCNARSLSSSLAALSA